MKNKLLGLFVLFCFILVRNGFTKEKVEISFSTDRLERLQGILKFPFYPQNHVGVSLSSMISSDYGMRSHPVLNGERFHNGVDLRLKYEPVRSILLGKIKFTGYNKGFGYYIIVEHLNGLTSSYAHLSKIGCSVDENVLPGQEIGVSGNSGRTTGPHLHFVVQYRGKTIDPKILLGIMFEGKSEQGRAEVLQ